jgi:hypothetical protein
MSKPKQTFTDPQTGEEIESTWLARWGGGLFSVLCASGLGIGLPLGLLFGLAAGWATGLLNGLLALVAGLVIGLVTGLPLGLLFGLYFLVADLDTVRYNPFCQRVHDGLARRQHLRRQRILRRQEFPHVPDGALSRAGPPGQPEPTAVSLSRAPAPEEDPPLRLTAGVNEASEEEELSVTLVNDCT